MCGIGGVVAKLGENVVPHVANMLSSMMHRGPDGIGIATSNKVVRSFTLGDLKLNELSGESVLGHTRLAIVGGALGLQPFTSCDGRIQLEHNGEIYNYRKLRSELSGSHRFETKTDSEVVVHLLEENYDGDLLEAVRKTVRRLDGVFTLAIRDDKDIMIARDRIGVRQLYYGENPQIAAFASEKKPLWMIGVKEVRRVLPGQAVIFSASSSSAGTTRTKRLLNPPVASRGRPVSDMSSAIAKYKAVLYGAMRKRIQELGRIGIIFSGGIDSVLVAKIAKDLGVPDLRCYSAGLVGSHDLRYSKKVAKKLGLQLKTKELTIHDIESLLPTIIEVIEDTNAGQVEVAVPVYAAIQMAHEDGLKVVLTGQGADELFGGYPWYSKIVEKKGYEEFHESMVNDLLLLYKETLEREDKIAMAHSIELRVPYLDPKVIRFALRVDPRLKIRNSQDTLGKHVHRELADLIGIPKSVAFRQKEAAQHGAGIHEVIEFIAKKKGFNAKSALEAGYGSTPGREKIGSSQRYGYMFGDEEMWVAEDYVQMFLDYLAFKHGFTELEGTKGLI